MKIPKTLDNLFNNIYFLYFIAFLAVFNIFTYIIINNFNAIIMFILIGYITYLFSKNMAIVLLVALLLTNLFTSSNKKSSGKEGFEDAANPLSKSNVKLPGISGNDASGNDASGNDASGNDASKTPEPTTTPTTTNSNKIKNIQSNIPTSTSESFQTTGGNGLNMDKLEGLLTKSKDLMNELKGLGIAIPGISIPGMSK